MEKVRNIREFVDKVVTENRLEQQWDKLRELGITRDLKALREFIRRVTSDAVTEEADMLTASGLTAKDVTNCATTKAREWFLHKLADEIELVQA